MKYLISVALKDKLKEMDIVYSDSLFIECHKRFTTVPLKALSNQVWIYLQFDIVGLSCFKFKLYYLTLFNISNINTFKLQRYRNMFRSWGE